MKMAIAATIKTTAAAIAIGIQFRSRVSVGGTSWGPVLTSGFYTLSFRVFILARRAIGDIGLHRDFGQLAEVRFAANVSAPAWAPEGTRGSGGSLKVDGGVAMPHLQRAGFFFPMRSLGSTLP
jgi:hypothetical protein